MWAALRTILALAALKILELESIDIRNAHLNGELHDVDVYMQQPNGFAEHDSMWVARLLKGLYVLKQGSHKWFRCLQEVLVELGFTCICSESSVFIWEKDGVKVIVPVFVTTSRLCPSRTLHTAQSRTHLVPPRCPDRPRARRAHSAS
jgi:hypothetical protein